MKYIKILGLLILVWFPFCSSALALTPGDALWAKSTTGDSIAAEFESLAVDSNKNIYAVGKIDDYTSGELGFGNNVTVTGVSGLSENPLIVKYDVNGDAQWAKSLTSSSGTNRLNFFSVAVDTAGNSYVVGYRFGNDTIGFGNGVTVSESSMGDCVLVKYDTNGEVQWAKSIASGGNSSNFPKVAVDGSGNVYVVGRIGNSSTTYDLGNGVSVAGGSDTNFNPVLVKYDSDGNAQWARTQTTVAGYSDFRGVAVDSVGNIYAGGVIYYGPAGFGNGVTVGRPTASDAALVKYNSNGDTQWARATISGDPISHFNYLAVDSFGNVYASGVMKEQGTYGFGNGVTVYAPCGCMASNKYSSLMVKYSSDGDAQWARSVTISSPSTTYIYSYFVSPAIDNGDLYTVHSVREGTVSYGGGVSHSTSKSDLLKYDLNGNAQWARGALYGALAVDGDGSIYSAGSMGSSSSFGGVSVSGASTSGSNPVIIKYYLAPPTSGGSSTTSAAPSVKPSKWSLLGAIGGALLMLQ